VNVLMLVIWRSYVYYTTMLHTQAEEERLQHRSISWSVGTCPGSARVQNTGRPFATPSTFSRLFTTWAIYLSFISFSKFYSIVVIRFCIFHKHMHVTPILTLVRCTYVHPFLFGSLLPKRFMF
jgi:hypothetical protein